MQFNVFLQRSISAQIILPAVFLAATSALSVAPSHAASNIGFLQAARTEKSVEEPTEDGDKAPKEGSEEGKMSCGALKPQKNAKPKNFADARKTKYVKGEGKVDITFEAGNKIPFECEKGFTTDGAKGGPTEFEVTCADLGYYTTEKVCVKESKCGELPTIKNALPTGEMKGDNAEFRCNKGFSLDGNKVIVGGFEKNARFTLKCTFQSVWGKFDGECQPVDFVSTADAISVYNQVFEVLFKVDCENELTRAKKKRDEYPTELDSVCGKMGDKSGECSGLVGEIKAEFEKEPDEFEAKGFCTKMWNLLSFGEAKAAKLFLTTLKTKTV